MIGPKTSFRILNATRIFKFNRLIAKKRIINGELLFFPLLPGKMSEATLAPMSEDNDFIKTIIGVVVGAIFVLLISVYFIWLCSRRCKRRRMANGTCKADGVKGETLLLDIPSSPCHEVPPRPKFRSNINSNRSQVLQRNMNLFFFRGKLPISNHVMFRFFIACKLLFYLLFL